MALPRVLYVLDHPGRLAGNELQVLALARYAAARGWPVRFAVRRGLGEPRGLPGPHFLYGLFPAPPVPRIEGQPLRRAAAAASAGLDLAVRFALKKPRWDVVHYSGAGLVTALSCRAARVPTVARISGLAGYEAGSIQRGPYRRFKRVMDWLYGGVTVFQVGGEAVREEVGLRNVTVIPNAVDPERFRPGDRLARRGELGLPAETFLAAFSGRLIASKGVDVLLEAARRDPGLHLVVLGDGPERARLEEQAGANIRFAGAVPDPERWLQACDAFLLPSRTEAAPNALLEAMACGLPCAATGHGSTAEMMGDAGVLLREGTPEEVLDAVHLFRKGTDLGERARQRVLERHHPDRVFPRFLELYRAA